MEHHIYMDTKLLFEWEHVMNTEGEPHIVSITYLNLAIHGRAIPRCPLQLPKHAGFRYNVAFLDAFAEAVKPDLTHQGIF